MLKSEDLPYFRSREAAERQAASSASDLTSRGVHLRMAEHYADRVWALERENAVSGEIDAIDGGAPDRSSASAPSLSV